jgi:hypothetical protein
VAELQRGDEGRGREAGREPDDDRAGIADRLVTSGITASRPHWKTVAAVAGSARSFRLIVRKIMATGMVSSTAVMRPPSHSAT